MIYGWYNSAAGMMVNEYRQDVLANNLANADTVGFKRDVAVFAERQQARVAGNRHGPSARGLRDLSGGLWLGKTHIDYSEASHVRTDNPLDVSLSGPGFLSVQVNGQRLYTRDGRMMMDRDGLLVAAADGAPVTGAAKARPRVQGGNRFFQLARIPVHLRTHSTSVWTFRQIFRAA